MIILVYNFIKSLLSEIKDNSNAPKLKKISLFNSENKGNEEVNITPSVYIEFPRIALQDQQGYQWTNDFEFLVHLVISSHKADNLEYVALGNEIFKKLAFQSMSIADAIPASTDERNILTGIVRNEVIIDSNQSNLIFYSQKFKAVYFDYSGEEEFVNQLINALNIQISEQ